MNDASAALHAKVILLVDDDVTVRKILQAILSHAGYCVVTAADGEGALTVASGHAFDLLLTDLQMPGMDGFELACQLTARSPLLPVLVISASGPESVPLEAIAARQWRFLAKPITSQRLLEVVAALCQGISSPANQGA